MKRLFFISLLALAAAFPSLAGGCNAQAQIAPMAPWCSNGTGRCVVFAAFGSGETTECTSNFASATCNKYDAYGGLIVSKFVYCVDF